MKKISLIITIFLLTLTISSCKKNNPPKYDDLGGGQIADDVEENKMERKDLLINEEIENPSSEKLCTEYNDIKYIDLNKLQSNTNYKFENDVLKINNSGIYELSGVLNGCVEVNGNPDTIVLILNNTVIKTTDTQTSPAITFKAHEGKRILSIKENTYNLLSDSVADTKENGDGAIIQAKKSSLIINGKGTLELQSLGEDTTAIKVKNNLEIYNTNLKIKTSNNGIKAGEILSLYQTSIELEAGNDGIKTDVEATSIKNGEQLTQNPFAGYIYIYHSNIKINSIDDGIIANSYMKIDNNDYLIDITTNNGAPSKITEISSDYADGKALKVDGINLIDENENETLLPSLCKNNYLLAILGGNFVINSNDDALSSKGNLLIDNGNFNITSGDDGIHAEYATKINNGNIIINNSYEGIEGAVVEIYGGTINLKAFDDGINAANADLKNYPFNIYIGGGDITVNANGDGIDSNGTIEFNGGKTVIYGPINGGNGSLDADKGIKMTSGILIALGSIGMVETPGSNSLQYSICYNLDSSATGELIVIDSSNNELIKVSNPKKYQSAIISLPEFQQGATYTIKTTNDTKTVTINNIITQVGNFFGHGGFGGGRPPR